MADPHNWDAWCISAGHGQELLLECPACNFEYEHPYVGASILELRKVAVLHAYQEHS